MCVCFLAEVVYYGIQIALRWAAIDPALNDTTLQSLLKLNRVSGPSRLVPS